MAYRRKQGITRSSTFKEDVNNRPLYRDALINATTSSSPSPFLTPRAFSSASRRASSFHSRSSSLPGLGTYDFTSLKTTNDQDVMWGVLTRNAKSFLDEENMSDQFVRRKQKPYTPIYTTNDQFHHPHKPVESSRQMDNTAPRKDWDSSTSITGNALERRSMVKNKASDILQDTRKLQIRTGTNQDANKHVPGVRKALPEPPNSAQPRMQSNPQTQLKASRDVAMATAAKAKMLLRELKTAKADLAYAKQRCSQLEEENKILRDAYGKDDHPADDEMIRVQLETLLSEKARLVHENSAFARENHHLREIVEFHQLTMQDLEYLDEGIEEFTEIYPIADSRIFSVPPSSNGSPAPEKSSSRSSAVIEEDLHAPSPVLTKSSQPETVVAPDSAPAHLQNRTQAIFPDTKR